MARGVLRQFRMLNYVWTDPSGLVTVRLSLGVLARLAGPIPALGGLLCGKSDFHNGRHLISIDSFEPFRSEELAQGFSRCPDAVGMFRVQTRRESKEIDSDDAAMFSEHFAWPNGVFLMVHPRLQRAAFYDPEGGNVKRLHHFTFELSDSPETGRRRAVRDHWPIEVLALTAGIAAGAILFQKAQPAPVKVAAPPAQIASPPAQIASPPAQIASPIEPPPLPQREIPDSNEEKAPAAAPKPIRPRTIRTDADRSQDQSSRPSPFSAPAKPAPERHPLPATSSVAVTAPPPAASEVAPVKRPTPEPLPEIAVQSEPVAGSRLNNVVSRIPLLRRLHHQADPVVPPTPLHRVSPELTAGERAELTNPVQVNVRVYVDEKGKVQYAELASDGKRHPNLASAAVFASRHWNFTPAEQDGQPVPGEVILHFRFAPSQSVPDSSQD